MKNMTHLRSKLIRLAHEKPELRGKLLPLLKMGRTTLKPGLILRRNKNERSNAYEKPYQVKVLREVDPGIWEVENDRGKIEIINEDELGGWDWRTAVSGGEAKAAALKLRPGIKVQEKDHPEWGAWKVLGKAKGTTSSWEIRSEDGRRERILDEGEAKDFWVEAGAKSASNREAITRWQPPRSSYIPKDNATLQPRKNIPEGLEIWTWEEFHQRSGKNVFYAIAFAGKADKPLWYHSFRDENQQERMIQETIKSYQARVDAKRQRMEERKNFQHGLQVGTVLVASWGYEQTNIDYYQVTDLLGKAVIVREIGKKLLKSDGYGSDTVAPDPGRFIGPPMKKIPQRGYNGEAYLKISDVQTAYPWDGKPDRQTSSGWGH